jgi:hypothetical protein
MIFFYVWSTSDQLIADDSSSNITIQPILTPIECQELDFWIGKGDEEERNEGKESPVYRVGIKMK